MTTRNNNLYQFYFFLDLVLPPLGKGSKTSKARPSFDDYDAKKGNGAASQAKAMMAKNRQKSDAAARKDVAVTFEDINGDM